EGTVKKVAKSKDRTKAYDSVDSYAAMYLLAVARYHQVTKSTPPRIISASRRSLQAIEAMVREDFLTIAKPDYPVKFLLNNLEVYAGLVEGGHFFRTIGDEEESWRAFLAADELATAMKKYWQAQGGYYA